MSPTRPHFMKQHFFPRPTRILHPWSLTSRRLRLDRNPLGPTKIRERKEGKGASLARRVIQTYALGPKPTAQPSNKQRWSDLRNVSTGKQRGNNRLTTDIGCLLHNYLAGDGECPCWQQALATPPIRLTPFLGSEW